MPQRIQRKRTKGWKMPPNTVYVGRPTKWGNPVPVFRDEQRTGAVEVYRDILQTNIRKGRRDISELRGKDLACWCPLVDKDGNKVPCHADVLLEIANATEEK